MYQRYSLVLNFQGRRVVQLINGLAVQFRYEVPVHINSHLDRAISPAGHERPWEIRPAEAAMGQTCAARRETSRA
jgi:hypothetical protein